MMSDEEKIRILKNIKPKTWLLIVGISNLLIFIALVYVTTFTAYTSEELGGVLALHGTAAFISLLILGLESGL